VIEIKEYTLADLAQLVRSNDFWNGDLIPITRHRALAQIKNPRARPDDVALLVAYDGERICGYTGLLPDLIFLGGQGHKIGWLTTWWRRPDPKYGVVGFALISKACDIYQGAIGGSAPSQAAARVFDASKRFVTLEKRMEVLAFVRANTMEMFPRRIRILQKFCLPLRALDRLANILCEARLRLWRKRYGIRGKLRLEYITELDPQTTDFVRELQEQDLHRRGAAEFNWIAQCPWIISAPLKEGRDKRYPFAAAAKESLCFMLKVFDSERTMIGFLILRIVDGQLKIPYCYMRSNRADEIFRVIAEHAVVLPIHTLLVSQSELRASMDRLKFPCLGRVTRSKSWVIGNVYGTKVAGQLRIQDGDGDCAFF
jgi:hypothetical protein